MRIACASGGDAGGARRRRAFLRLLAALFIGASLGAEPARAQDATWTGPGAEWTTGSNWSSASVPSDTATFTNNGAPTSVTISNSTSISEVLFEAGAPPYSFTVQGSSTVFSVDGIGIVNNSFFAPTININSGESLYFEGTSTAGNATIINNGGVYFDDTSTAGNAQITNNDGVLFSDTSTAGNATITNNYHLVFEDTSTAGNATIINNGGGAYGLYFEGTSTAGNATIINNYGVYFDDTSTAGNAQITNNDGVLFSDTSTAGNATITNNYHLVFEDTSTAGNATIINNAGGTVDFSVSTGPNNDGNVSAGSIAGAGDYYLGADELTVGSNNLSTDVSGIISDCGTGGTQCEDTGASGGGLIKVGTGTLTLSGINTYTGSTTVDGGTLEVDGSITDTSSVTVNSGGTLAGTGMVDPVTVSINSGGMFLPGMPGVAGGTLTIDGNLMLASGSTTLSNVSPAVASLGLITGTAALAGTLDANGTGGAYTDGKKYTVLTANGGLGGTTYSNFVITGSFGSMMPEVSYDPDDVYLTLVPARLNLPPGAPQNDVNVANAIDVANVGTPPLAFQDLFTLSPGELENALTQLSGEAATGAQQSGFQMMNSFMSLLLDPYADGRDGGFGGAAGPTALGYTADNGAQLPPAMAEAYASVLKEPAAPPPPHWNVWGAGFGGANENAGNASVGSHDTSTGAGGFAIGADDYVAPGTMLGFAIAGGGTAWSLSSGLGGGRSDVFQAGLYGVKEFGPAYLAGAFGFGNYWASTNRNVTIAGGGTLDANFDAQGYGGRLEGGYHIPLESFTLTPYGAVQPQAFTTPAYSEYAASGSSAFALNYNAQTGTEVRGELGTWVSRTMLLANGNALNLFGRAAWAHDWQSNPALSADFLALPTASFVVNGAAPPPDLALVTLGGELRLPNGWTLMAKLDGEFGRGSETYAGTGSLTYTW